MTPGSPPTKLEPSHLYLLVCVQAIQDGVIDEEEQEFLDHLREVIGLSASEAEALLSRARAELDAGQLVEGGQLDPELAFESACELAWADGWVERKERVLLELVGRLFRISPARAAEILAATRPHR